MTTLSPGTSWNGTTSWSGRTPPTASTTLRGSGWPQKAIGAFNRAPYLWWSADFTVVVGAEHGDDDWIEEVEFWLEGNTTTVTTVTKDADTNDIGFAITIQLPSGSKGDGEIHARRRCEASSAARARGASPPGAGIRMDMSGMRSKPPMRKVGSSPLRPTR